MENHRIPSIRFKGFSDAWEQRKLGEITYQSGEKNVDDLPYESYSVSNTEGFINQKEQFKYGGLVSVADKSKSIIVTPHTFAYNPARIDIGSIGYQNLDKNVIISPMYEIFKAKNEFLDDRFLWHWLKSDIFKQIVVNNQEGGVRTCFNLPKFFEACITIPKSVKEQRLIGIFFDSIDQSITLHQRKCQVLINTKKALLEKMFPSEHEAMPKIRFKGFSDAWEQRKLNNYLDVSTEINNDLSFDKSDVLSVSGDFGVVNQIEFQGRSFAGESVSNYGVLRTHQVVYTKSPLKANPYGIIKTNKGKDGIVSVLYGVYQPKENVCSELIQTYFEQDARLNNYLKPLVNKGAKNTLLISDDAAINGEITFPKQYDEQVKIYCLFEKLDSLITLHQRKCEKLKNMKKSLLEKMFI